MSIKIDYDQHAADFAAEDLIALQNGTHELQQSTGPEDPDEGDWQPKTVTPEQLIQLHRRTLAVAHARDALARKQKAEQERQQGYRIEFWGDDPFLAEQVRVSLVTHRSQPQSEINKKARTNKKSAGRRSSAASGDGNDDGEGDPEAIDELAGTPEELQQLQLNPDSINFASTKLAVYYKRTGKTPPSLSDSLTALSKEFDANPRKFADKKKADYPYLLAAAITHCPLQSTFAKHIADMYVMPAVICEIKIAAEKYIKSYSANNKQVQQEAISSLPEILMHILQKAKNGFCLDDDTTMSLMNKHISDSIKPVFRAYLRTAEDVSAGFGVISEYSKVEKMAIAYKQKMNECEDILRDAYEFSTDEQKTTARIKLAEAKAKYAEYSSFLHAQREYDASDDEAGFHLDMLPSSSKNTEEIAEFDEYRQTQFIVPAITNPAVIKAYPAIQELSGPLLTIADYFLRAANAKHYDIARTHIECLQKYLPEGSAVLSALQQVADTFPPEKKPEYEYFNIFNVLPLEYALEKRMPTRIRATAAPVIVEEAPSDAPALDALVEEVVELQYIEASEPEVAEPMFAEKAANDPYFYADGEPMFVEKAANEPVFAETAANEAVFAELFTSEPALFASIALQKTTKRNAPIWYFNPQLPATVPKATDALEPLWRVVNPIPAGQTSIFGTVPQFSVVPEKRKRAPPKRKPPILPDCQTTLFDI